MTPDEHVEALAEVVRAGLRKCRHEDAPAPLIHEADLTHITHMVTAELATALRDPLASERAKALREHGSEPWQPSDGDMRCQECGHNYQPWFTDNSLWNEVMGGSAYGGDPGGYLCPRCFAIRADESFPRIIWRVIPQWNGRAEAMDWPHADREVQP